DRAGRRSAEADEYLRLDQGQLGFEPRTSGLELVRPWCLMDSALATLLELEVLDRVGDVELLALEPRFGQRLVKHLAGRTDERRALPIFLIPRLFSDEHDPCGGRAPAEDGLRGVAVQIAAGTARGSRAELAERRARWGDVAPARQRTSVARTLSRRSARAAACHPSNVGSISTVFISTTQCYLHRELYSIPRYQPAGGGAIC